MLNAFGHPVEWCWLIISIQHCSALFNSTCYTRLVTLLSEGDWTFLLFSGVKNNVELVWLPSSTTYNKVVFNRLKWYWIRFSKVLHPTLTQSLIDLFDLAEREETGIRAKRCNRWAKNHPKRLAESQRSGKNTENTQQVSFAKLYFNAFFLRKTSIIFDRISGICKLSHYRFIQTLKLRICYLLSTSKDVDRIRFYQVSTPWL